MDKLHSIEAFPVLLAVVNDSGNIRMLDLRGRACLTEEARTSRGICRQFRVMTFSATVELRMVSRAQ